MGKVKRKPHPEVPGWYWEDSDNCWRCKNRNNCRNCSRLKRLAAKTNKHHDETHMPINKPNDID